MTRRHRFFSDLSSIFDRAASFTDHPAGLLDQIKRCNAVFRFDFPVRQSDGGIQVVRAWRVEHSHHRLPLKGGIRYSAEVDGQIIPGSMTIEAAGDGYTGQIRSDFFPTIPISAVTVVDQAVTIEASGPDGPLLIEFVAVERTLDGTWAMGEQGGTFTATKMN